MVVGPSGCGKSTLLRTMNGLEPIQDGQITYRDKKVDAKNKDITEIRQKVGMVFQSYELFPHMSILDNITLSPILVQKKERKEAEKEAEDLLRRVGLIDKKDAYPRQLSGGQKQRQFQRSHGNQVAVRISKRRYFGYENKRSYGYCCVGRKCP